ncbi:MAG: DNA polymerase III subunit delta' [Cycloclasticus sp. symbiont of Poecilosclerida sp. N]|nr:MAG: DNA polymerase III subunit delta' [Cycloclasticus sp. symbiont of Poecilosclerida sp. N]
MNKQTPVVYPWLQSYWEQLSRYQQQDRLPSGIMLVADKGLGLSSFAVAFANRVVCLSSNSNEFACGTCKSCLLFSAGNYPDFIHLQPAEGEARIKIDAIRKLSESLALSSQYAKPRIVIIDPASAMLHQASNSLLKTLEEPSDNTSLILLADKISSIPATIRSRCQVISVKGVDLEQAEHWLKSKGCDDAMQYLNLAVHLPLEAHDLWKKDALAVRAEIFKHFVSLVKGKLDPLVFAEKCLALKDWPIQKWIMSWLTDAIKEVNDSSTIKLINPDFKADLNVLKEKLDLRSRYALLDKLTELMGLQSSPLNQQLLLEDFAIQCYSLTVK